MQFTKLNSTHIINGTHTTDTDHCNSCKTTLLLDVLIFKTYPNSELRPLPIWQRQYWSDMEVELSSLVCVFFPIRSLNSRCPLPPLPPSCTRFLRYQGDTSTILGWYQGDTRCSPAVHLCMLHLSPHCTTPAHSRWTVGELVNYRWAGVMMVEGDSEDFLWNRSHSTTIQVILHWADRWSPTLSTNFFRVFVRSAKGALFSTLPHKRT